MTEAVGEQNHLPHGWDVRKMKKDWGPTHSFNNTSPVPKRSQNYFTVATI